jgi:hypothetical protein
MKMIEIVYGVIWVRRGVRYRLLWRSPEEGSDRFVMSAAANRLTVFRSDEERESFASAAGYSLANQPDFVLNFLSADKVLNEAARGRSLNPKSASLLLDTINQIEDLERSLVAGHCARRPRRIKAKRDVLYKKLFLSCQLPSVRRWRRRYLAIFEKSDLDQLRLWMNELKRIAFRCF